MMVIVCHQEHIFSVSRETIITKAGKFFYLNNYRIFIIKSPTIVGLFVCSAGK